MGWWGRRRLLMLRRQCMWWCERGGGMRHLVRPCTILVQLSLGSVLSWLARKCPKSHAHSPTHFGVVKTKCHTRLCAQ